jgi:hypothetical protein
MIGGALGARVLVPTRIDKNFIWLTKVSPEYLASFPDWRASKESPDAPGQAARYRPSA